LAPEGGSGKLFHDVTKNDIEWLISAAGQENVITSPEKLLDYGHDEAPLVQPALPQAAVTPHNAETISSILKYANGKRTRSPRAGRAQG
jgi:FAD/FMN-containing dehydrogenase